MYFQDSYVYKAYSEDTNDLIVSLLEEGCSIQGISRVVKITPKTVLVQVTHRFIYFKVIMESKYFKKNGARQWRSLSDNDSKSIA